MCFIQLSSFCLQSLSVCRCKTLIGLIYISCHFSTKLDKLSGEFLGCCLHSKTSLCLCSSDGCSRCCLLQYFRCYHLQLLTLITKYLKTQFSVETSSFLVPLCLCSHRCYRCRWTLTAIIDMVQPAELKAVLHTKFIWLCATNKLVIFF